MSIAAGVEIFVSSRSVVIIILTTEAGGQINH